jgi:hypothetical protein
MFCIFVQVLQLGHSGTYGHVRNGLQQAAARGESFFLLSASDCESTGPNSVDEQEGDSVT